MNNGIVQKVPPMKSRPSSERDRAYTEGSIGADLPKRGYIKYLIDRLYYFKEAQENAGANHGRFSYAVIYRNIESTFKTQTFFVPVEKFPELASFLIVRIDRTILGRRNKARGISNYSSFEEYQEKHMASA